MDKKPSATEARAWDIAAAVVDPEIPVVTVADLGILRHIQTKADGSLVVQLTPTYSGCPAVLAIEQAVESALVEAGFKANIERVLTPAWTTDWISEEGKQKLKQYGIAPPTKINSNVATPIKLFQTVEVPCPRCDSSRTRRISEFGSTACKAQYQCDACLEPFDYFKCL